MPPFRILAVAAALAAVTGAAPAARADAIANAETAFEPVVQRMAVNINPCLGGGNDRIRRVSLIGVPLFNRHLDQADRNIVNAALVRVVNGVSGWRAVPQEIGGMLPSILTGGPRAAEQLRAQLEARGDAPLILAADTARPDAGTLKLRLALFGRDGAGALLCNTTGTVELDAETFAALAASAGSGTDYVLLRGALVESLTRMAPRIAGAPQLVLATDAAALPDGCVLKRDLSDIVADIVFSLRNEGLELGGGWPPIRETPAPEGAQALTLRVEIRPSVPAPQAVTAVVSLSGPEGLLDRVRSDALVPPVQAAGCAAPPPTVTADAARPTASAGTDEVSGEDDAGVRPAAPRSDGAGDAGAADRAGGVAADDPPAGDPDGAAAGADPVTAPRTDEAEDVQEEPAVAADGAPGHAPEEPASTAPSAPDDTGREPEADPVAAGPAAATEEPGTEPATSPEEPDTRGPQEDQRFLFFPDRPRYRAGEAVTLTLVAAEDCDLTIVNVDDKGRSCVLVPTPGLDDIRLEAGVPYTFPPPPATFAFPDPGTETLIALCNASEAAVAEVRRLTEPVSCAAPGESAADYESRVLELGVLNLAGPVSRRTLILEIEP